MLGLEGLSAIIGDPDLRQRVGQLAARKIKADLKTLEAQAELSRQLVSAKRGPGPEGAELKRIIQEHLDFYGALIELSTSFHQRLLDSLQGRSGAEPAVNGLTLDLKAPVGATLRAPFRISNNRPDPISVTCKASPFVSEDGATLRESRIAFLPPGADIAPGAAETFEAIVPVGADFAPGQTWLATLKADGVEAMEILVRLHVEPGRPPETKTPAQPAAKPSRKRKARAATS
jgi:hypothetical protein